PCTCGEQCVLSSFELLICFIGCERSIVPVGHCAVGAFMEDHEVDLRVFLGILRRRAILIVSIFVFCLAIGVCMALVLPARYSSTALLRVDPRQDDGLGPAINRSAGLVSENARIESVVEILRAAPTFARVIENQDVDLAGAFPERPTVLDRLLAFLGMVV